MNAQPQAEALSFSAEYDLPHPPAKVWRALTEPELLARWLMPNDMRAKVGESFTFKSDPTPWWDGIVRCEVQEVDPQKRMRYTWKSGSGPQELDTVVTWTLSPNASGGTLLRLDHTGFDRVRSGHAYEGMKKGWPRLIGKLRETLAAA